MRLSTKVHMDDADMKEVWFERPKIRIQPVYILFSQCYFTKWYPLRFCRFDTDFESFVIIASIISIQFLFHITTAKKIQLGKQEQRKTKTLNKI